MFYPQALHRFIATAVSGMSPLYAVTPKGGRGNKEKASTAKKATTKKAGRPSTGKKNGHPSANKRTTAEPQRQSPRLHPSPGQQLLSLPRSQRIRLGSPRRDILDAINEGFEEEVSPLKESSVASSEDLLEPSQSNNTIVPETQYGEVQETELQMPPLPAPTLTDARMTCYKKEGMLGRLEACHPLTKASRCGQIMTKPSVNLEKYLQVWERHITSCPPENNSIKSTMKSSEITTRKYM